MQRGYPIIDGIVVPEKADQQEHSSFSPAFQVAESGSYY